MEKANVYAFYWCFWVVATVVVASRLVIRLRWGLRRLYLEDYFIIMAWVSYVGLNIVLSVGLSSGLAASGRGNRSTDEKTEVLKTFFLHGYFLYTTLWLVKASLVSFYARISWNTSQLYRVIAYITLSIIGCSYIIVMFFKTFYCFPLSRVFDPSDQCTGGSVAQYTRTAYLLTTSLLDIIDDLICLILPFCILRNLHISLRKKIALGILFAIALLSLVCGCIRLTLGVTGGTKFQVATWGVVEATTALCVASAPALRPVFFRTSYLVRGTSNMIGGSIGSPPNPREMNETKGQRESRPFRTTDLSDDDSDRRIDILEMLNSAPSRKRDTDSIKRLTQRVDKIGTEDSDDPSGDELKGREDV